MPLPRFALACDACSYVPPEDTLAALHTHGVLEHGHPVDGPVALKSYVRIFCGGCTSAPELALVRTEPGRQVYECPACRRVAEFDHRLLLTNVAREIRQRLDKDPSGATAGSALIKL